MNFEEWFASWCDRNNSGLRANWNLYREDAMNPTVGFSEYCLGQFALLEPGAWAATDAALQKDKGE